MLGPHGLGRRGCRGAGRVRASRAGLGPRPRPEERAPQAGPGRARITDLRAQLRASWTRRAPSGVRGRRSLWVPPRSRRKKPVWSLKQRGGNARAEPICESGAPRSEHARRAAGLPPRGRGVGGALRGGAPGRGGGVGGRRRVQAELRSGTRRPGAGPWWGGARLCGWGHEGRGQRNRLVRAEQAGSVRIARACEAGQGLGRGRPWSGGGPQSGELG